MTLSFLEEIIPQASSREAKKHQKQYLAHIDRLNKALRAEMWDQGMQEEFGFTLEILPRTWNKFLKEDGVMFENQVETFVEVLKECLRQPERCGVLIGSPQLGKTMTCILTQVVAMALAFKKQERYLPILLLPVQTSLEDQTKQDYLQYNQHYDVELVEVLPVEKRGRRKAAQKLRREPQRERWSNYISQISHNLAPIHNLESLDMPIIRRTGSVKVQKEIEDILETVNKADAAGERKVNLLIIADEYHWGEGVSGSMFKFLEKFAINQKKNGHIMIGMSATPFHLTGLSTLWKVCCRVYPGYVGYAFFNGKLLDPRFPLRTPRHISLECKASLTDCLGPTVKDLPSINRAAYHSSKSFYTWIDPKRLARLKKVNRKDKMAKLFEGWTWEEYKEHVEGVLVKFINACLTKKNPLNKNGMVIRFFKRKYDLDDFLNRVKGLSRNIKAVAWQGTFARDRVDVFLKNQGIEECEKVVVFVTGSGRMGNRFDQRFGYFVDFADKSHLISLIQGLPGRACGENDVEPWVFLSEENTKTLNAYVQSLGDTLKGKVHSTIKSKETEGFLNIRDSITLEWQPTNARDGVWASNLLGHTLAEKFDNWVAKQMENGIKRRHEKEVFDQFWEFFSDELFDMIEEKLKLPHYILTRYTQNEQLRHSEAQYRDRYNYCYSGVIGFRDVSKQSSNNSNVSGKNVPVRLLNLMWTKNNDKLQPQILVDFSGPVPRLVAIKFRTRHECVVGQTEVLPTPRSSANHFFATEEEKKREKEWAA